MPENETDKIEQEAAVIDTDANANVDKDLKADADETVDADADDNKTDDSQKEVSKKKPSIFDTIKNIIRRKPDDGTADADDSDGGSDTDDSTSEGKDIPAQFTEAAIAAGMNAEQISEHASDYTDAQLLEQIPDLKPQVSENSDESEQLSKKETGDTENKDGEKATDDAKDEEIKLLKERLDKVEKGQLQNSEQEVQNQFISRATAANKRMDELSKEFEIFGTYKTLPRFPHNQAIIPSSPQAKARNEVWGLAEDLHMKAGMDFDMALNISLDAFKGKHLSADVKRNLVKDLKRNEKQLSAKRSSHEAVKTDLSGPELIREIGKKHGLEIR